VPTRVCVVCEQRGEESTEPLAPPLNSETQTTRGPRAPLATNTPILSGDDHTSNAKSTKDSALPLFTPVDRFVAKRTSTTNQPNDRPRHTSTLLGY